MKRIQKFVLLLALVSFGMSFAQENSNRRERNKERKAVKKVDKVNGEIKKVNNKITSTNESVKSSVADTKNTVEEMKQTFNSLFPKKNKNKAKGIVSIQITQVTYDNPDLNLLYKGISSFKGVKNPSKNFENNNVIIKLTYKKSVDDLWQSIPESVRGAFKVVKISDNTMLLNLAEQSPAVNVEN